MQLPHAWAVAMFAVVPMYISYAVAACIPLQRPQMNIINIDEGGANWCRLSCTGMH